MSAVQTNNTDGRDGKNLNLELEGNTTKQTVRYLWLKIIRTKKHPKNPMHHFPTTERLRPQRGILVNLTVSTNNLQYLHDEERSGDFNGE